MPAEVALVESLMDLVAIKETLVNLFGISQFTAKRSYPLMSLNAFSSNSLVR